ncbi:signal transduction histidine kinase [Alkalibacillus filiformis]|uniref:histidine kinase n=1 Tax=Alkalibacillus filiformis TaxID=200990 RepID=A0ABU0DSP9_9BACI|nr:HAMP domain-containing sensor histidine kinase [Alkalibacillus filiformis]MDQ0351482.1 signal transduction histidine kinase [Alkalibacillus filiformis]
MKNATENIFDNKSELSLDTKRKDELGVLARTITRLSEDLTQLRDERSEFLSNISHELRTPLTYIKGYADILSRREISKEETERYSTIIKNEADELSKLIKNLFDLAKVDQHEFVINKEWVSLYDITQSVFEKMVPAFNSKNITLDINCSKDLKAFVDQERIQQVLINILDNAQKYSEENTRIFINVSENHYHTKITIKDEGEGIPKEEIPKVFNRLYRVEKSRSRLSGGSGIGLAITKEIIESHGGAVSLDSTRGEGTTVIITLPKE